MTHEAMVLATINRLFDEEEFEHVFADDVLVNCPLCWEEVEEAMENLRLRGVIGVEAGSGLVLFSSETL